jgi:hypothetical protein
MRKRDRATQSEHEARPSFRKSVPPMASLAIARPGTAAATNPMDSHDWSCAENKENVKLPKPSQSAAQRSATGRCHFLTEAA